MGMAERIKERRLLMNFTQEELAKRLGLQKSAIAKYENGRVENIKRSVIQHMADILECSPAYLMGWEEPAEFQRGIPDFSNIHPIAKRRFPILGSVSCGVPKFAQEDRESYVMAGTDIKADFCLIASGDSMTGARIMDGDIVFIRQQETVENGEIAAVEINDEATLKRVYYYADKALLILKAENPKYEDFIYTNEQLNEVHILGKAVAFQSDVE